MSLKKYSHEELEKLSMIDLANLMLLDEKKAMDFRDIFEKIAEIKGFSDDEKQERIAQFYTDLNINGHFITLGSNMWGLKRWYPVEQIDEEITAAPKKKKKSKKKKKAEKKEEDFDADEDSLDVVENDLEELTANFKDDDDDDDDFEDYNDYDDDDFDSSDEEDNDDNDDDDDEEDDK